MTTITLSETDIKTIGRKIDLAFKRLCRENESIKIVQRRTSKYDYGITCPFVYDRYDLDIKLDDTHSIKCQILFDPSDYYYPPDISFKRTPKLINNDGIASLLPQNSWDLDKEDCVHEWFEKILNLIEKPLVPKKEETKRKWSVFDLEPDSDKVPELVNEKGKGVDMSDLIAIDTSDDDFDLTLSKTEKGHSKIFNSMKLKEESIDMGDALNPTTKKRRLLQKREDIIAKQNRILASIHATRISSSSDKVNIFKESVTNKGSRLPDLFEEEEEDVQIVDMDKMPVITTKQNKEKSESLEGTGLLSARREFVVDWIYRYQNNVIRYDSKRFMNMTFYFKFNIPKKSEMWETFLKVKLERMENFIKKNSIKSKMSKPKPFAPMLVNFRLDKNFPSSALRIRLISTLNTPRVGSSEPDMKEIEYKIEDYNSARTNAEIYKFIAKNAVIFHMKQV